MAFEMLDLGVIMGSQSMEIFLDMVDRYPGARYFYDDFVGRCQCGQPDCARSAMQATLTHLFDDDKERIAAFFDKLSHCDMQPTEMQIRAILGELGLVVGTQSEEDIVEARIQEELRKQFPGSTIIRLH